MVIVTLTGGLGNQMFEYAAARRLALHHDTVLKLDVSAYNKQPAHETPRHYELDCFKLKATMAEESELPPRGLAAKITRLLHGQKNNSLQVCTQGFGFNPDILTAPDNTLLQGSLMNPKYFEDVADKIRTDFSFAKPPTGKNNDTAKQIKSVESISLHVRRGDYASDEATSKNHGLASLTYYQTAIQQITKQVKKPHFFVISDDPAWCKANLIIDFPVVYIDHNVGIGFEDLRLMSLCSHHIIANSSFSWWGAWLNPDPRKIVYAPEHWFANIDIDSRDFTPPDWIRL